MTWEPNLETNIEYARDFLLPSSREWECKIGEEVELVIDYSNRHIDAVTASGRVKVWGYSGWRASLPDRVTELMRMANADGQKL